MPKPQDPTTPTTVYALKDQAGRVFYIGQTVNLKARLNSHRGRFLRRFGSFTADVLDVVPSADADTTEQRHIADLLEAGVELANHQHNPANYYNSSASQVRYTNGSQRLYVSFTEGECYSVRFHFEMSQAEQEQAILSLAADVQKAHPGNPIEQRARHLVERLRPKYTVGKSTFPCSLTRENLAKLQRYAARHKLPESNLSYAVEHLVCSLLAAE